MDLTFQVPMQYCFLYIRPCFYHQSHPQPGIVFALAPSLHFSVVISPLISSSILGTYRPGEFLFQYPIILPFHTVHGVLKARILKWFAISFSSGPHSVRRRLRGATPRPRSSGCMSTGGPRGATPRLRSGGAAVRRYPLSKVRSSSCTLLEQR